jgi:RNA polymerase sigma-70 factor (ECF subfamily)
MVRIVINEVKQQFRKKKLTMISLEEANDAPSENDGVESVLIHDEERRSLRQALERLPPEQKEAVVLHYFSELTVPEIAAITSQREGTIKARLSRAIDRLNEILGRDGMWEVRR